MSPEVGQANIGWKGFVFLAVVVVLLLLAGGADFDSAQHAADTARQAKETSGR